jgi:hypothetical protein
MIKNLILTLIPQDGAAIVRVDPFHHLAQSGYPIENRVVTQATFADVEWCDMLYVHRGHSDAHLESVMNAVRLGKKIVADVDDDYLNIPYDNPVHLFYSTPKVKSNITKILEMAHLITLSSEYMIPFYSKINPNYRFIECVYSDTILKMRKEPAKERAKVISWRGSATHMKSLMEFADSIVEVENAHQGWQWNFIGDNPWYIIERFKNSGSFVTSWVEPMNYLDYMINTQPAIHFLVLTDNSFTRSRSYSGYFDATLGGAVTVAPDWHHWRQPGVALYQDKKSFVRTMNSLMDAFEKGEDLSKPVKVAWEHINKFQTIQVVNKKRVKLLGELFPKGGLK